MKVEDFIVLAEDYAEAALAHLLLDQSIEPVADYQKHAEIINAISTFSKNHPAGFTWHSNYHRLICHYLFPNLSEDERKPIVTMYSMAIHYGGKPPDESSMGRWREAKARVDVFETKLTAMQMAILETKSFHP